MCMYNLYTWGVYMCILYIYIYLWSIQTHLCVCIAEKHRNICHHQRLCGLTCVPFSLRLLCQCYHYFAVYTVYTFCKKRAVMVTTKEKHHIISQTTIYSSQCQLDVGLEETYLLLCVVWNKLQMTLAFKFFKNVIALSVSVLLILVPPRSLPHEPKISICLKVGYPNVFPT